MKCASAFLFAAMLALAAPAQAEPEPPVAGEAAISPAPVTPPRIRVGGPCAYETTEIMATLVDLSDDNALMLPEDGRSFSLNAAVFPQKGAEAVAGKSYHISKRAITTGTCFPVIYDLIGPATDEAAPAD